MRAVPEPLRLVRDAVIDTMRSPRAWLPALVLLLPTLALQLAFPGWLRSRLSPSMWTVVAGGLAIAWLTQVATVAAVALVHRARGGSTAGAMAVARVALVSGTAAWAGLLAGVGPGLWVQGRWAFAPLGAEGTGVRGRLEDSARATRGRMTGLVALAITALALSVLGQSLAASLAEAAGTIVPVRVVDGRTEFTLHYLPHALTSLLAWSLAAMSVSVHAVGISLAHARGTLPAGVAHRPRATAWPSPARAAVWVSAIALLALGLAAATHKVQQHLY